MKRRQDASQPAPMKHQTDFILMRHSDEIKLTIKYMIEEAVSRHGPERGRKEIRNDGKYNHGHTR
jgi:hypothetical protein